VTDDPPPPPYAQIDLPDGSGGFLLPGRLALDLADAVRRHLAATGGAADGLAAADLALLAYAARARRGR
jgi:hypothetical protein